MAQGEWSMKLKDATPKSVRDRIRPFDHIVISAAPVRAGGMSTAAVFDQALYVGPILSPPGRSLEFGGAGNSWWLGGGQVLENAMSSAGATLSTWLSALRGDHVTLGTVTSPGGLVPGAFQWISPRDAVAAICESFGVEWRVSNGFDLDAGSITNLYGATPVAIATPDSHASGDAGIIGLDSIVDVTYDFSDYATKVIVHGQGGRGDAGGAHPTFVGPTGTPLTLTKVLDSSAAPGGETAAALAELARQDAELGREVTVSAKRYGLTRQVKAGETMRIYDPEFGLFDGTNQQHYAGRTVWPLETRILAVRWPIEAGMSVLVATQAGEFTDLSDYIEFESGDANLEVAWQFRPTSGRQTSSALKFSPWTPYTPVWTSNPSPNPTLGLGTLVGNTKREGSALSLRGTLTIGGGSFFGSGTWRFTIPPGFTAATGAGPQTIAGSALDVSTGQTWTFGGVIQPGGTFIEFQSSDPTVGFISGGEPFFWGTGDQLNWTGIIEIET